jgi:hypothetical protein
MLKAIKLFNRGKSTAINSIFNNELSYILDPRLNSFTRYCLLLAPEYWYHAPSSVDHHHYKDEWKKGGRVLHAKRTCRVAMALCDACSIGDLDRDIVLSGALLHDICVWGADDEPVSNRALPQHPKLAADKIRQVYSTYRFNTPPIMWPRVLLNMFTGGKKMDNYAPGFVTIERLANIIESHMGKWGNKEPMSNIAKILHTADLITSRDYIRVTPLGKKIK